jgi:ribonuclease HI
MDLVYIYADESCLGNQYTDRDSPGGAGGLVELWRDDTWVRRDYWSSEPGTTNNRMALRERASCSNALRRPCRVVFTSDSQYLVTGMREWIHGWARRGWKRKAGPSRTWSCGRSSRGRRRHEVDWRWVRGHAGHPQNEYVNDLAIRAAREQSSSGGLVESGFVSGWRGTAKAPALHGLSRDGAARPSAVLGCGAAAGLRPARSAGQVVSGSRFLRSPGPNSPASNPAMTATATSSSVGGCAGAAPGIASPAASQHALHGRHAVLPDAARHDAVEVGQVGG